MTISSPRLALVALPAAFLLAVACSSSSGDEGASSSSSSSSSGGADGGSSGASTSSSTSSSSSGTVPEAGAAGPFCASLGASVAFCEDFDDGTMPAVGDTQVDPGGSLAIVDDVSRSSPKSLRVVSAPATGDYTNALLRVGADPPKGTPSRVVAGFAYRGVTVPADKIVVVARLFLSATHQITVEVASADGAVVREIDQGGLDVHTSLTKAPAPGTWTRLEIDADLAAKKLVVRADGATVADAALSGTTTGLYAFNVGLTTDLAASATVNVDDVTLAFP